jgi:hypothetical protein
VHVQLLSISPESIDNGRDNNELVFRDKVPYASFLACGLVSSMCGDIKFKGRNEWKGNEEQHKAAES